MDPAFYSIRKKIDVFIDYSRDKIGCIKSVRADAGSKHPLLFLYFQKSGTLLIF